MTPAPTPPWKQRERRSTRLPPLEALEARIDAFEEAAFKLKECETSGIVETSNLKMTSPLLKVAATGKVDLVQSTIDMLANALYLLAAREGPLSLVVTLSSLYPASTVLLARVVLGERLNRWQLTGVACALAAVVLVGSGGRL